MLASLVNLAWFLTILGVFIGVQVWTVRGIERDTPPRE